MKPLNKNYTDKGFTLAEMIIVVAIIGVMAAISIPIFSAQIEKARDTADIANLRSAKAEAVAVLTAGKLDDGTALQPSTDYWYNMETGSFQAKQLNAGYGQGTARGNYYSSSNNDYGYSSNTDYKNGAIQMNYTLGTDGKKTVRICFKQYNVKWGSAGHPDDWSRAKTFTM